MEEENVFLQDIVSRNEVNPFLEDIASRNISSYDSQFFSPVIFTGKTGVGESMFDNRRVPFDELGNLNEIRAQRQPWVLKTTAGVARVANKALAEIAKMPGVVGGIIGGGIGQIADLVTGEDNTDFVKVAFDNAWINAVTDAEEFIKEEALPVYVKKAVSEGNLWDNITSMDFWATEGADGIGYITSMLAPGAVINKFGVGAKVLGANKLANMATKAKDADKALKALNLTGLTAKNADLATATFANTLFEAAAEAKGAMDSYEHKLNFQLENGEISQAQYDEQIQNKSGIGANVFKTNALILLGPNAIMSKMLWGKARNRIPNGLLSNGKLQPIKDPSLLTRSKRLGKDLLYAGSREGFFEEGLQSTAEQYFTENPEAGLGSLIGDLPSAYLESISEVEGQKAIFLGALLGGGMQMYTGAKNRKAERANTNKLVDAGNTMLSDFYNVFNEDIYVRNEDGEVEYTEKIVNGESLKKPKIDIIKAIEKTKSLNQLEQLSAIYDLAIENNNVDQIAQIKDILTTNLIKPFIVNDNLGLEVLEQHLKESEDLSNIADREGNTKDSIVSEVMDKAKKLKSDYNLFQNFGESIFKLTNNKATAQEKVDFYNRLSMEYLDQKARKYFLDDKIKEANELDTQVRKDLKNLGDPTIESLTDEEVEIQDARLIKLKGELIGLVNEDKRTTKILNAFWDGKSAQKRFNSEISKKRQLEKQLKVEEEANKEIIAKFNAATTVQELDEIEIPEGVSQEGLQKLKEDKRKELIANEETARESSEAEEAEFTEEELAKKQSDKDKFDFIANNFNVGEVITVPDISTLPDSLQGQDATILAINESDVSIETADGKKFDIGNTTFLNITGKDTDNSSASEGGTTTLQEETLDPNAKLYENRNQPRIIVTDNNKGKKLSFIDQAALDFERSPIDKTGKQKGIEVNNLENPSDNQQLAINMLNNNDFSDINHLIDHLPLNIKLTDSVVAPIETKSDKSDSYNTIFNKTTRELRTTIVKELAQGTKIEDITVPIVGQNDGVIQVTKAPVEENLLTGLYEFGGNIGNIKTEDIFFVDDFGTLVNNQGDIMSSKRALSSGEVYLRIHTAAGRPFPLKLNIAKISEDKATLLYNLYTSRFKDFTDEEGGGELKRISELEEFNNIKTTFKSELELFNKSEDDITVKDLIDFIIWEGSSSLKSQLRFTKTGKLLVLDKSYTAEQFTDEGVKQEFIDTLTNNKRHQIKFKRKETDSNNLNIADNREYLEYLITEGILNTNAVVNEPTFQGKTTMYLGKDQVMINGIESKFNSDIQKTFSPRLIGDNTKLKNILPQLFSKVYTLNEEGNLYIDKDGNEYNRATSLKDKPFNSKSLKMYNAAKRGDVVDELVRIFFSKSNLNKDEFIKRALTQLKSINENKPKTELEISKNYFESLYNILEQYKLEFDRLNYTIYSNVPALGGKIGSKGNIAGTIDLLAYDNVDKSWVLIDLKTSTSDRGIEYDKELDEEYITKKGFSYRKQDTIQLNTYKELFRQQTGVTVSDLKIMPLTSKSEDLGKDNSVFYSISTSKRGLLLNIDTSESIYQILGIDKKDIPTNNEEANETDEEKASRATNVGVLGRFGINVPDVPKKEVPKPKPKKKVEINKDLQQRFTDDAIKALHEDRATVPFELGSNTYILTHNFYVINVDKRQVLINDKQTLEIIKAYNKIQEKFPTFKLNIENAKKAWKERINKESPVEVETEDQIDFNKLSEEKAKEIFMNLYKNYKVYIKDIQAISKQHKGNKEKVQALIEFLKNKSISEESIKIKCKG